MDRRGLVSRTATNSATTARALAFDLVREIFDATGTVSFDSQPRGAVVEIDGEPIGTTPVSQRLPVGNHSYRVRIADHRDAEGSIEIASASSSLVQHDLGLLPGKLSIDGAPEGAILLVNGAEWGTANALAELEPGNYTIEVRANGYLSFHDNVRVLPGQTIQRAVLLNPAPTLLKRIPPEAITISRYGARLAYDVGFHSTTFRNARGEIDAQELEFRGFTQDGVLPTGQLSRFVSPHGVRAEAYYTGENFGLTLLSLSYLQSSTELAAELEVRQSREIVPVTVTDVRRLQLRPFQLSYRMFFDNFVPVLEGGIGIGFQWIDVSGELLAKPTTLSQTEAFWTLGLGLQYFFTPNLAAMVRYNAQSYFNPGLGVEHMLNLGIGMVFGNVFGFEAEPPGKL